MCWKRTPTRISRPPRILRSRRAPRVRPTASCSSASWTWDCGIARSGGPRMAEAARAALAAATMLAALGLLNACADQSKLRESELTQLLDWLPGRYDNTAQADSDAQRGVQPPHDRMALIIVNVYTPRLGH